MDLLSGASMFVWNLSIRLQVKEKKCMAANDEQVWMAIRLLSRANEEIAALGGIPGAPLDTEAWIQRHLRVVPREFAFEDWSSYRPAMRKVRLLVMGRDEFGRRGAGVERDER